VRRLHQRAKHRHRERPRAHDDDAKRFHRHGPM